MTKQNELMNNSYFNIADFGAVADGETLCTKAIRMAVEACESQGGGTILVPPGRYLTGPIELKSHVHLYLSAGSVLMLSDDQSLFPIVEARWEGAEGLVYMPMIYGKGIHHVAISGYGTLDGQGMSWWTAFKEKRLSYPRPRLISFEECSSIRIENIECVNSPAWTINPVRCSDVTIHGVSVHNPPNSPNTDGINPDSCLNVRISNCHVDVGDDCITIKSGTEKSVYRIPCENISITNCTLVHGHGGVVIGSEMSGGVKNVVISNCIFSGTDRGIRLKTRRGRGGVVEDLLVNNCIMEDVLCPFVLNQYYFCGEGGKEKKVWDKCPYPIDVGTPVFKGIHFNQITAKNASYAAGFLYGLPESPLSDISFSNIRITLKPDAEPGMPAMMDGLEPLSGRGFICHNTENLSFNNVSVGKHHGPAFEFHHCSDITLNACSGLGSLKVLTTDHCVRTSVDGKSFE